MEKGQPSWYRACLLCRDPASQLNSLSKFIFVYRRGGLEIFHINALKRAGLPRKAKLVKAPYTRQSLSWPACLCLGSSVCLCAGYKMKTCTQISDSGFRGEINVVN